MNIFRLLKNNSNNYYNKDYKIMIVEQVVY